MPRTLKPKPKPHTQRVSFHLTIDMIKSIKRRADSTGQNTSQVIREALDKYFKIEAQREDSEFFSNIVRSSVRDEIGRQANRLAAMLFKIGIISAGNFLCC